jgi:peptidoglycan/LPS O-acetylase OafA/YrhL
MRFRADINGLRAIAVVAVVLFHLGVPGIAGGYAGVDVFFVISGYLMTQIILTRIDRQLFSVWNFWWERFARIFPALAVLCTVLLIFGWFFIEPLNYQAMARSVCTSISFISNFEYMTEGGYFGSELNWLLHTWSLSVEWQFYLLYPIFLIVVKRLLPGRSLLFWLILVSAGSFGASVACTYLKPSIAFYMLPTRAWELLAGGLAYLGLGSMARRTARMAAFTEALGLALIVLSIWIFDRDTIWPSFRAAVPVAGTFLVIVAGREERTLLAPLPIQLLGRWSYSIYLWHWPLIVASRYFDWPHIVRLWGVPALGLILGGLSYRVERPCERYVRSLGISGRFKLAAAAPGCLVAVALAVMLAVGVPSRAVDAATVARTIEARRSWAYPASCEGFASDGSIRTCRLGGGAPSTALVIGDSEAEEWYPRYQAMSLGKAPLSVTFAARAGCPPVVTVKRVEPGHKCDLYMRGAMDLAARGSFERIVFIAAWSEYFDSASTLSIAICASDAIDCARERDAQSLRRFLVTDFEAELARLTSLKKSVFVVLPFPTPGYSMPLLLARQAFFERRPLLPTELSVARYDAENADVRMALMEAARAAHARVIDPADYMCHGPRCSLTDATGWPLFIDAVHLGPDAVRSQFDFLDSAISGVNDSVTRHVQAAGSTS